MQIEFEELPEAEPVGEDHWLHVGRLGLFLNSCSI